MPPGEEKRKKGGEPGLIPQRSGEKRVVPRGNTSRKGRKGVMPGNEKNFPNEAGGGKQQTDAIRGGEF